MSLQPLSHSLPPRSQVQPPSRAYDPLLLEPVPELLSRARTELAAMFDFSEPIRVSRAPGRLDVMGGIADYTGSLVCEMPLDRAVALMTQRRADRDIQIFSFNLFDQQLACTFRMPLDALASVTIPELRAGFAEPSRRWASYIAGCLAMLHEQGLVDLRNPAIKGFNVALLSKVPMGAGISSSAAVEVASMLNFIDELLTIPLPGGADSSVIPAISRQDDENPLRLAELCQMVENRIAGAPCGIMDQVTSYLGHPGSLLRLICQPHELRDSLSLPPNVRVVGVNSAVKHSVAGGMYGRTRCAAFMGHAIILRKMQEIGAAGGKLLVGDPMNGYLANLPIDEYKMVFRQFVPEFMMGGEFIQRFGQTIDKATTIDPDFNYHIQHATDHHVLESHRVRKFVGFLEDAANAVPGSQEQVRLLDKAGHLMYASHLSYTNDAMLGADECDLLVDLVRQRESKGFYGAKITGGGSGGTVAILCDKDSSTNAALDDILSIYERETGRKPEAFTGTSPGAWLTGTVVI